MKRFEELLAAYQHECIGYGVAGGVTGGGGIETAPLVAARSALVEYVREMAQDIDAVEQLICESAPLVWIRTVPSHEDYGQRMAHAARWEKAAYTWLHRHDKSELDEVPQ